MKKTMTRFLILTLGILLCGIPALGQTLDEDDSSSAPEKVEGYGDFIVKGYSISFTTGHYGGATFLENPLLGPKVAYTLGANDILRYFPNDEDGYGTSLPESTQRIGDSFVYQGARKEADAGQAYNLKVGIYIADNFHLDLIGSYIDSRATTTMVKVDLEDAENNVREELDYDDGFKIYKGGVALMYDAEPAKFFGITPRLGFSLGGVINRYTQLEDKTALYLEANFALNYRLFKNLDITGQIDSATYAFEVDEFGYSEMIQFTTFSLGASWFIDVLPSNIRAAHEATKR